MKKSKYTCRFRERFLHESSCQLLSVEEMHTHRKQRQRREAPSSSPRDQLPLLTMMCVVELLSQDPREGCLALKAAARYENLTLFLQVAFHNMPELMRNAARVEVWKTLFALSRTDYNVQIELQH